MKQERIILKKLREQNQLSLKQAAQLIGRSKGWLSQIENGISRLAVERIKKFKVN